MEEVHIEIGSSINMPPVQGVDHLVSLQVAALPPSTAPPPVLGAELNATQSPPSPVSPTPAEPYSPVPPPGVPLPVGPPMVTPMVPVDSPPSVYGTPMDPADTPPSAAADLARGEQGGAAGAMPSPVPGPAPVPVPVPVAARDQPDISCISDISCTMPPAGERHAEPSGAAATAQEVAEEAPRRHRQRRSRSSSSDSPRKRSQDAYTLAIPEAVADNLESIRSEHKAIKLRLREYETAFEQRHGRKPKKKKDWAPVYQDYERYSALREAEKAAQEAAAERFGSGYV